jgi:phage terminase large subunit
MLLRRLSNPGTAGLIFRRVYDDLKRNHIDKFFEEFPHLFRYYRATDHEVVLPATRGQAPSRIVFGYAETEAEVRRKFHGPEYMDMFVDQAEQLGEQELRVMRTACRWPGTSRYKCKFVLFFNPGGIGIAYLKRIFHDRHYLEQEQADDYAFIQAYGWDNVEWCRSALVEDGLGEEDFYRWSNDQRYTYFVTRTQYGLELSALPQALRIGYLMGSFDVFAGQYFDKPPRPVSPPQLEPWHPRWVSIDWGFSHDAAVCWWAQDGATTYTYRELVVAGRGPRALAQEILDRTMPQPEEKIESIYISPDTTHKRGLGDTICQQMSSVFVAAGWPAMRVAEDDRVSGFMLMHEMLERGTWKISSACPQLLRNLPLFSRDPDNQEDCVKFSGDDIGDSARYGLRSRFSSREAPRRVQLQQVLTATASRASPLDKGAQYTAMHIAHLRFVQNWAHTHAPVRRIRSWRQG